MATTTIAFDKFTFVQTLEKRGFARPQAEAIAEAVTDIALANLVSKADLQTATNELRRELKDFQIGLYKTLAGILVAHGIGTAALTVALIQLLK